MKKARQLLNQLGSQKNEVLDDQELLREIQDNLKEVIDSYDEISSGFKRINKILRRHAITKSLVNGIRQAESTGDKLLSELERSVKAIDLRKVK